MGRSSTGFLSRSKAFETFRASYKPRVVHNLIKPGALSLFGTAIQDTIKSVLCSAVNNAQKEHMLEEERV
jgi:hypothetical protein